MNLKKQSIVLKQCNTAIELKNELQRIAKNLLYYPIEIFPENIEVNINALHDLTHTNLKRQESPIFILSELCRLLIRLGDRTSLDLCLKLSYQIYAFKCRKNESLTISYLYRGISQIGLNMTDLGVKNVSIGLSGQDAFPIVPEDRIFAFWALMSAAIIKKNINLAFSFLKKWRQAACKGDIKTEIFRANAVVLLFHLLNGDCDSCLQSFETLKCNPPKEWKDTALFFENWVKTLLNRECYDIGNFFEPYPLFLGLKWRIPTESMLKSISAEDFRTLCYFRRKFCNESVINLLQMDQIKKILCVYKNWELSGPVYELESTLIHRDRDKYFPSSLTRLFGDRIFQKILGDTTINPDVERCDNAIMLFMDVRKFTSLCEKCSPEEIFPILNPIFKIMNEDIEKAGGMILDFQGDCIIIIFNIFDDLHSKTEEILSQTVGSLKRIYLHNAMSLQTGQADIRIGVGINKGPVALGYLGGLDRCHLTVMGSAINVASRLESASKVLPGDIIISKSCFDIGEPDVWANPMTVNYSVRDLGLYNKMKNVSKPVRLFGISPLLNYWIDFVPMGFVASPEKGVVYLDVGNSDRPGVIDHHFETASAKSACELLVYHPELLWDQVKGVPPSQIEFRLHHNPDPDCAASFYAARELMDLNPRMETLYKLAEYISLVDQAKIPGAETMSDSLNGVFHAHRLLATRKNRKGITDFKILEAQVRVVDAAVYLMAESGNRGHFSSIFQLRSHWFAEEKELIRADIDHYREDLKLRSRTYTAPVNGISEPVTGLWLDHPKSIFFRIWAWNDVRAPGGNGYPFLALDLSEPGKRRFVIGVDPEAGTDMKGLGQLMEKHESEKRKKLGRERPVHPIRYPSDNSDPWYFGQGHCYAVIDSPGRGTVLTAVEVRGIHKDWENREKHIGNANF